MTENERRFVLPGDEIAESEEYMAGEGTYEKDGKVYAAITGFLEFDKNEMEARVMAATSRPVVLKPGDLVFGTVYDARGSIALINVVKTVDRHRQIAMGDTMGSLHISKIQSGFLKDIGEAFKVGDILRAKVTQVEPSLQLTTEASDLGVINANCLDCQVPLEKKGNVLECPRCEKKYRKKVAEDYGKIQL